MLQIKQMKNKLARYHQHAFLENLHALSEEKQKVILNELFSYPWEKIFKKIKGSIFGNFTTPLVSTSQNLTTLPKMGVLILAGGQGSRLGHDLPKALIEIAKNTTLIDWHLSKIDKTVPTFILCSKQNIELIQNHLEKQKHPNLHLLCQSEMPLLDLNDQFFLKEESLATAPNGNGDALLLIKPFLPLFEHLMILPIDNPKATPIDKALISEHIANKNEVTIKVIKEDNPKMGLVVQNDQKLTIIDYTEDEYEKAKQVSQYCNTGIYCISSKFLQKSRDDLPLHLAKKNNTKKPESFLFDHFAKASKIGIQLDTKQACFSPIKTQEDLKNLLTN